MSDETVEYPEALQRAALASAKGAQQAARRELSAHLGATTPYGRVALFLDTREGMTGIDQEEIASVGSPVSGHEMVTLLASDLRTLLSEPTEAEVWVCAKALCRDGWSGGFRGAEADFEDYWDFALTPSTRQAYYDKALVVLATHYAIRGTLPTEEKP